MLVRRECHDRERVLDSAERRLGGQRNGGSYASITVWPSILGWTMVRAHCGTYHCPAGERGCRSIDGGRADRGCRPPLRGSAPLVCLAAVFTSPFKTVALPQGSCYEFAFARAASPSSSPSLWRRDCFRTLMMYLPIRTETPMTTPLRIQQPPRRNGVCTCTPAL